MNRQSVKLVRLVFAALVVLALGQSAALAKDRHRNGIEGVWNSRVNITDCTADGAPGNVILVSFDAINVFAADGTFLDTNSQTSPATSEHLGYWRHVRGHRYEFAMRFFLFDAAGVSIGSRIVRHDVVLSPSGSGFASRGTAETYDEDGVLLGTGCSTSTGIRFR